METQVKERPIIFSDAMVRALLDGRKTQTRRVVKSATGYFNVNSTMDGQVCGLEVIDENEGYVKQLLCPYGQPGDQLWVRETLFWSTCDDDWCYQADNCQLWTARQDDAYTANILKHEKKAIPSIHMPREASRLLLEITAVRCERLQDINEEDAVAEGVNLVEDDIFYEDYRDKNRMVAGAQMSYMTLWESINGPGSWELNPWVWVVTFQRVEA